MLNTSEIPIYIIKKRPLLSWSTTQFLIFFNLLFYWLIKENELFTALHLKIRKPCLSPKQLFINIIIEI